MKKLHALLALIGTAVILVVKLGSVSARTDPPRASHRSPHTSECTGVRGGEYCTEHDQCLDGKCDKSRHECERCPSRGEETCHFPGTCDASDARTMQEAVHRICDTGCSSCQELGSTSNQREVQCQPILRTIETCEKCLEARDRLMQQCYRGGDDRHTQHRRAVAENRDRCKDLLGAKKGNNLCISCSQSDYESYDRDKRQACEKKHECDEQQNDAQVDCRSIEDRYNHGKECLKAIEYLKDRCFDGRMSSFRLSERQEVEKRTEHCKNVLEYKKDKKYCR